MRRKSTNVYLAMVRRANATIRRARAGLLRDLRARRLACAHARAYRAVDSLYDPYEEAHVYCPSCRWHWYAEDGCEIEVGGVEFRDRLAKGEPVPKPRRA